jgi:hypothetical protein
MELLLARVIPNLKTPEIYHQHQHPSDFCEIANFITPFPTMMVIWQLGTQPLNYSMSVTSRF